MERPVSFRHKVDPKYETEDHPVFYHSEAYIQKVRFWKCPSFGSRYQVQRTVEPLERENFGKHIGHLSLELQIKSGFSLMGKMQFDTSGSQAPTPAPGKRPGCWPCPRRGFSRQTRTRYPSVTKAWLRPFSALLLYLQEVSDIQGAGGKN